MNKYFSHLTSRHRLGAPFFLNAPLFWGVCLISFPETIHRGGIHSLQCFIKNIFFVSEVNLKQIINIFALIPFSSAARLFKKWFVYIFWGNTVFSFWSLLHSARAAPFWKCNIGRSRSEGNLKVERKVGKPVRRLERLFVWLKTGSNHLQHRGCGPWKLLTALHLLSLAVASSEPLSSSYPGQLCFGSGPQPATDSSSWWQVKPQNKDCVLIFQPFTEITMFVINSRLCPLNVMNHPRLASWLITSTRHTLLNSETESVQTLQI